MTFASVLLFCVAGIALCATLVFVVETAVAFCLHEKERFVQPKATLASGAREERDFLRDLAA
jgi:hypothetical protein